MFFFMQILSIGGAFQAFCFEILPIFGRRSPCVDSYFSSVFKPPFKRYPSFSVEFSKETNTVLFFSGVRNNNITRKKQSKYDIVFLGFQPLCFLCFFVEVQFKKKIGRIQESIETFFSSMSAGAQALYEDRTKTATLIGGLTLLAGGGGLVGVLTRVWLGRSGRGFLRNKPPEDVGSSRDQELTF